MGRRSIVRRLRTLLCVVVAGILLTLAGASVAIACTECAQHYKCYDIDGHNPSHRVKLVDQFGIHPNVKVGRAVKLCTPAAKVVREGPPPPGLEGAPLDHLVCYRIRPKTEPAALVNTTDQFGQEEVTVGESRLLCVPSAKGLLEAGQ